MLTAIGLSFNFIGSLVLLGSDVEIIKHLLKRVDPINYVYQLGLKHIINESVDEEMVNDNRAHPYDGPIRPVRWLWWPLSRFLDRHAKQDISSNAEVDIQGGWFKLDGEQLIFPERRIVQLDENAQLDAGDTISLTVIHGLLYEAFIRRIYIYGVSFFAIGFLLQLIDLLAL